MLPEIPNQVARPPSGVVLGIRAPVITGVGAIRFGRCDGYFQSYRLFGL